jgi:hypothetical protein
MNFSLIETSLPDDAFEARNAVLQGDECLSGILFGAAGRGSRRRAVVIRSLHKDTPTLVRDYESLFAEHADRVCDGHRGDPVLIGELPRRRKSFPRFQVTGADGLSELVGQLHVRRAGIVETDRHAFNLDRPHRSPSSLARPRGD